MSTYILVFASDQHSGSTLGLLNPGGVPMDDGQMIMPSIPQQWLWEKNMEFVSDIKEIAAGEPDASLHYFNVGDLTDGWHHGTHQVISVDQGVHVEAATRVLEEGVLTIPFDSIHMLRGTPAHVQAAAGLEKSVAARLNAHGYPVVRDHTTTNSFVWPFIYAEFGGILFDIRHHGKTGQLERTRKSYAALYADEIHRVHINEGRRPPDVAVRAHKHKAMDSGPDHRGVTRLLSLGCWQHSSEWVRSKSIEGFPDIGGCVVVVRNGNYFVKTLLYKPDPNPQPIWHPEDNPKKKVRRKFKKKA